VREQVGLFTSCGAVYWAGAAVFVGLLALQHTARRLPFDWVNGAASLAFAVGAVTEMLLWNFSLLSTKNCQAFFEAVEIQFVVSVFRVYGFEISFAV